MTRCGRTKKESKIAHCFDVQIKELKYFYKRRVFVSKHTMTNIKMSVLWDVVLCNSAVLNHSTNMNGICFKGSELLLKSAAIYPLHYTKFKYNLLIFLKDGSLYIKWYIWRKSLINVLNFNWNILFLTFNEAEVKNIWLHLLLWVTYANFIT